MNLPIDVIPNSNPPRFRWRQIVPTPAGTKSVEYNGAQLPPSVEGAVIQLIELAKQQYADNVELRKKLELLTPKAAPPQPTPRKGK